MDQSQVFLKMAVSAWETENSRVTKLLDSFTDEQLLTETAPGRNRGIYLIGHLTAVSDAMSTLFGWGAVLYPQLDEIFIKNPDKSKESPSPALVREYWSKVYANVGKNIAQMTAEQWFSRHTAVSAEDFAKEPHRNKLNVLLSRTNHMSYHRAQLVYLVKK